MSELCDFYSDEAHYLKTQVVNIGLRQLGVSQRALTFDKIEDAPVVDATTKRFRIYAKVGEAMEPYSTEVVLTPAELDEMAQPYRESKQRKEARLQRMRDTALNVPETDAPRLFAWACCDCGEDDKNTIPMHRQEQGKRVIRAICLDCLFQRWTLRHMMQWRSSEGERG